jgi:transcriptional regulator with XRE-family HTH domain
MAARYKPGKRPIRTFITQYRERAGLTKRDLAEKLGISEATQSRYESGGIRVPLEYLDDCASLLGCTVADLLSRDPRKPPSEAFRRALELLRSAEEQ